MKWKPGRKEGSADHGRHCHRKPKGQLVGGLSSTEYWDRTIRSPRLVGSSALRWGGVRFGHPVDKVVCTEYSSIQLWLFSLIIAACFARCLVILSGRVYWRLFCETCCLRCGLLVGIDFSGQPRCRSSMESTIYTALRV